MNKTPKPYLSYSQMSCLNWSEKKYIDQYIYKKGSDNNDFLKLGKDIHKSLELRDKKFIEIQNQIPEYEQKEIELKVNLGDIPLYGLIDGLNYNPLSITDYKTGQKPSLNSWNKQMTFYNVMLFQQHKEIAKENKIYWIKTKIDDNGLLIPTNEVREFLIEISIKDIILMTSEIKNTWEKIKQLVEREKMMFGEDLPCFKQSV